MRNNAAYLTPMTEGVTIVEITNVYDGWSILINEDGEWLNRWENDEGTGPEPGYEGRWKATQDYIEANKKGTE